MEAVLFMREVAENILAFSDPRTKKALSQTCRRCRSIYIALYFPRGLSMQPIGRKLVHSSCCSTCGLPKVTRCICLMDRDHCLTYRFYCRSRACMRSDLETSLRVMVEMLRADGLQNRYLFDTNALEYIRSFACNKPHIERFHDELIREVSLFNRAWTDDELTIESCALHAREHMILDRPVISKPNVFVVGVMSRPKSPLE